jgi:protein gp37
MSTATAIEWTDATWNPVAGCSIHSPGCKNCYAMPMAARIERMNPAATHYAGLTQPSKAGAVWTGKVALAPDSILLAPLRWKKPRRIFVNSMSDLFHEAVPDEWIDRIFAVMALTPQHTYQVLTKRAERMHDYMVEGENENTDRFESIADAAVSFAGDAAAAPLLDMDWPPPNVWPGVSTERQQEADERIPFLLDTPAAVRFVSAEPLLGPVDLLPYLFITTHADDEQLRITPEGMKAELPFNDPATTRLEDISTPRLDWVIAGGESGPKARPSHPDWFRSLRDQCRAAEVPFFFKQWGEWVPEEMKPDHESTYLADLKAGRTWRFAATPLRRVGKKAAGALLDGREHREFPQ